MKKNLCKTRVRATLIVAAVLALMTYSSPSWSEVGVGDTSDDMGEVSSDVVEDTTMPPEDVAEDMAEDMAEPDVPEDTEQPPEDTAMAEDTSMPEDTEQPPEDTSMPPDMAVGPGEGGLTGVYYNNTDFTGETVSRVDGPVNFDWGDGAVPVDGIEGSNYAVRWTGQIVPIYSELYTIHTISDDGVRLWVDGRLLVDGWINQGATEYTGTLQLNEGQAYDIVLDYYQGGGGATIQLLWSSNSQVEEHIPAVQLEPVSSVLTREPIIGIKAIDLSAAEASQNTASFVVWRYGRLDQPLSVNLDIGGTAVNGEDYTELPTVLEFAANQSARRVEVITLDDRESEGSENISVMIAGGGGYSVSEQNSAEFSVADDEMPGAAPTWSIAGEIRYDGVRQGQYVVGVYGDAGLTDELARLIVFAPGIYSISGLGEGVYYVSSWLDEDGNETLDPGELTAVFEGPLTVPPDVFNTDLEFVEPEEAEDGCGCTTIHRSLPSPWRYGVVVMVFGLLAGFRRVKRRDL